MPDDVLSELAHFFAAEINLISDPRFESGSRRAYPFDAISSPATGITTSPTIEGLYSLQVGGGDVCYVLELGWLPGYSMTFSADCDGQGAIGLAFFNPALATPTLLAVQTPTSATGLQTITAAGTAPNATTGVACYCTSLSGRTLFDRLVAVPGLVAVPFFDGDSGGCEWEGQRFFSSSRRLGAPANLQFMAMIAGPHWSNDSAVASTAAVPAQAALVPVAPVPAPGAAVPPPPPPPPVTVAPAVTVPPLSTGTAIAGAVLTVTSGAWTGTPTPTIAFQWQTSLSATGPWGNVPGATGDFFALSTAQVGYHLRCVVTAENTAGSVTVTTPATAAVTAVNVAPALVSAPVLAGVAQVASVLTATAGTWGGNPPPAISYQWQMSSTGVSGWTNVPAAVNSYYAPQASDVAQYLRCVVTATNVAGSATASTAATAAIPAAAVRLLKDFGYTILNGLPVAPTRYFKLEESAWAVMADASPSNRPGRYATMMVAASGDTNGAQPGYLLDQHVKTRSVCFAGGHGKNTYNTYTIGVRGTIDNPNGQSWSMVLAGLKVHDMTVQRPWHALTQTGVDAGMNVLVNPDGSITVSAAPGATATSAPGMITRFLAHLLVVSYDDAAGQITVYVGDLTGRWVTAINAAPLANVTAATANQVAYLGRADVSANYADGFLDDFALFIGHAITSGEASVLLTAAGYAAPLSYPVSQGHRNAPLNQPYPPTVAIDAGSVAAAAQLSTDTARQAGGGGFDYTQHTTAIYRVSKAFRCNPSNLAGLVAGPSHYGNAPQTMQFEDCPVPLSGRPSLGFAPSAVHGHLSVVCEETDEVWDMGVVVNAGTDTSPAWTVSYGGKITQMSLVWTSFESTSLGARATGIPDHVGVPTVAELQAAVAGTPLPRGIAMVVYDAATTQVWPARRHDGTIAGYPVIEGQLYRIKQDAGSTALIAAMPHATGRAMAHAAQTYGLLAVDKNASVTMLQAEDRYQFQTVNGYDPYHQDAAGVLSNGLLNGQATADLTLAGFPWGSLELIDAAKINPGDATQPVQAPPAAVSGTRTAGAATLAWADNPLVDHWNVYVKTASAYTLAAATMWPNYTIWNLPSSGVTLAVTAVNGGGESARSSDFTFVSAAPGPVTPPVITVATGMLALRQNGTRIVDSANNPVVLRGCSLGGWLNWEGWIFGGGYVGETAIITKLATLVGATAAAAFHANVRNTMIREADLAYIASIGLNVVRIPFSYKILEDPTQPPGAYLPQGWAWLDNVIGWCANHGVYAILDMHAAPGGQAAGFIYDDPTGPLLWDSPAHQADCINLWQAIAARYATNPAVAGYDLLNEPWASGTFGVTGSNDVALGSMYSRIAAAIRTVDTNHILFLEGREDSRYFGAWATGTPIDSNMVLTPHIYSWSRTITSAGPTAGQADLTAYTAQAQALGVPLWVGEMGENSPAQTGQQIAMFEAAAIHSGWAYWTYKVNALGVVNIALSAAWQTLITWLTSTTAPAPTVAQATQGMQDILNALPVSVPNAAMITSLTTGWQP